MKKNLGRFLSIFIALSMLFALLPVTSYAQGGTTYYVSTSGTDAQGAGSEAAPFKTISYAVEQMSSGDILLVMPGTYNELLSIDGLSSVTIRAYDSDRRPVVTGADVISASAWQKHEGNVWKTTVSTEFSNGDRDIVFQNDTLCMEARWPNLTNSSSDGSHMLLNRDNYARVDLGGTSAPAITDASLSELSGKNINGAYVWCPGGYAYWAYISQITSFADTTLALSNTTAAGAKVFDGTGYWPYGEDQTNGRFSNDVANIYYIFGAYDLMDTNGEWYRDGKTLYFYSDSSEAPVGVELRSRLNTVKISNSSNVEIDGIDFRAGIVEFTDTTSNCTIRNSVMQTLDYWMPKTGTSGQNKRPGALGAKISGTNNLVIKCEIKNMYGEGITLDGKRNRVINNHIHDINFEATYSDGVYISGTEHLVSHNTIEHLGRSSIGGSFTKAVVSYNDISDGNKLTRDGGLVYVSNKNFENTEFHHNVLSDNTDNEGISYGLYFDSFTSGMVVYRNLLYGLEQIDNSQSASMSSTYFNRGNLYFNNTIANSRYIGGGSYDTDRAQTMFVNNIFTSKFHDAPWADVVKSHNLVSANCLEDDYTLKSTATDAIDVGMVIPGVTDGSVGSPDIGAFEYGAEKWVAGHNFADSTYENEEYMLNAQIPYRNLIKNGDFEEPITDGNINNWTTTGKTSLLESSAWTTWGLFSKCGVKSLQLDSNATATQVITGLLPNTAYEVGTYGMVSGEYHAANDGYSKVEDYPDLKVGASAIKGFDSAETSHCLHYESMDFGTKGYDGIRIGVAFGNSSDRTTSANRTITIREGSVSGTVLGTITIAKSEVPYSAADYVWKAAQFNEPVTGTKDIYICFDGDFYDATVDGHYYFNSSTSQDDALELTAISDAGEMASVSFTDDIMPDKMGMVTVTTGIDGSITVKLAKEGGVLLGFADEVHVHQAFSENAQTMGAAMLQNLSVVSGGKAVYGIRKGKEHTICGNILNRSTSSDEITVSYAAYNSDDTVYGDITTYSVIIGAGEVSELNADITAPLEDGAYFMLTLTDSKGESTKYLISDNSMNNLYKGANDVFVKDFSVRGADGALIADPVGGAMNIFDVYVNNTTSNTIPITGILAVYVGEALVDVMSYTGNIAPHSEDNFYLGSVLPESDSIRVKVFAWNNMTDIKPILEAQEMSK